MTDPDRRIGIAFVGAGMVAELHQAALAEVEGAELVGIYRRDQQECERRAARWGVQSFASYDQLLADPRVDAVFVLSPLESHRDHALRAIAAGKHVLIEKPVGRSIDEVVEIAAAAARRGVECMPGHNYVYQPDLWRARRLIDRGDLGRVCSVWVTYIIHHTEEIAAMYPGILRQVLTHHLYSLLYLVGDPATLVAFKSRLHYDKLEQEDQASLLLAYDNGLMAHLFASFAMNDSTASPWTFVVKVLGTNGGIQFSWRDAFFARADAVGSLPYALPVYEESYVYEDRHFIERCIRQGQAPLSTMEDAAVAQALIEAAEQSIRTEAVVPVRQVALLRERSAGAK